MWCPNRLVHVIRQGDTLYRLAEQYHTTASAIMAHNPHVDPYNLRIGSSLLICPKEPPMYRPQPTMTPPRSGMTQPMMPRQQSTTTRPLMPQPQPATTQPMMTQSQPATTQPMMTQLFPMHASQSTADTVSTAQFSLSNDMRMAWEQHVYWTRMLLISIAERLADQPDVTNRLLQNPYDIAAIFNRYYPDSVAQLIAQLLTEHLQIGAALITALRDGNTAEAENLNRQWYANADKMAEAFSSINPHYDREALRQMLHDHLKLTTEEVSMRLAANYPADIQAFDNVEREAMAMADYFIQGIVTQFSLG